MGDNMTIKEKLMGWKTSAKENIVNYRYVDIQGHAGELQLILAFIVWIYATQNITENKWKVHIQV